MYILLAILLFVLILVVRALRFKPKQIKREEAVKPNFDYEKYKNDMIDLIKCKTVSYIDESLQDFDEFYRLQDILKVKFPLLHEKAELTKIDKTGLLYRIKGRDSSKANVLMAHYDVVPVVQELWTQDAFSGIIIDDVMYGRGTIDTKGTFCGILEAVEFSLSENYVSEYDLYLSFSGNEETTGETCRNIVKHLVDNNIDINFVLDEGGAVVSNTFPGVKEDTAMIGIGEKGLCNIKLSLNSDGGHASTPKKHTIVGQLAKCAVLIENNPFKTEYTSAVAATFDTLGRYSSFAYKILFANLWCFLPLLKLVCSLIGNELGAMMRTTAAITVSKGSDAYNVLPPTAELGLNLRLLGSTTVDKAVEHLRKTIKNDNVKIEVVNGENPSRISDTDCKQWDMLSSVVASVWPEAIVAPYLMVACSDSRSYSKISDKVYRFSAMTLSKAERGTMHGHDERIPLKTLFTIFDFYYNLLKKL